MKILAGIIAACWLSALSVFSQSNDWSWARPVSTMGNGTADGIVTDFRHNIYMVGSFDHFLPMGDTSFVPVSSMDTYISKFDPDGIFYWAVHIYATGGFAPSVGYNKLEILNDSSFVVYGQFRGDLHISDQTLSPQGEGWSTYVAKFDFQGNLMKVYQIGGSWDVYNHLLKADKNGNLFLTVQFFYGGYISTLSFGNDTTFTLNRTSQFLAKFSPDLTLEWVYKYSCLYDFSWAGNLMTDESGNVTLMIPDVRAAVIFNKDTLRPQTVYPAFFHTFNSGGVPVSFHQVPNHAINWSAQDADHDIYTLGEIWQHDTLIVGNDTIITQNNYDLLVRDWRDDLLSIGYRKVEDSIEEINLGLKAVITGNIYGTYVLKRDLLNFRRIENSVGLVYHKQCWSMGLEYTQTDDDVRFLFKVSLAGFNKLGVQ